MRASERETEIAQEIELERERVRVTEGGTGRQSGREKARKC